MQTESDTARVSEWRLAGRSFRGTPEQIAAEIDELIVTLVACRQALRVAPQPPVRRPASTWAGLMPFRARKEG